MIPTPDLAVLLFLFGKFSYCRLAWLTMTDAHLSSAVSSSASGTVQRLSGSCGRTCLGPSYAVAGKCVRCTDILASTCDESGVTTAWYVCCFSQVGRSFTDIDFSTISNGSGSGYDLLSTGECSSTCPGQTFPSKGVCKPCTDDNALTCTSVASLSWFVPFSPAELDVTSLFNVKLTLLLVSPLAVNLQLSSPRANA